MKNIELTEDHKVKLLEMCKKLFLDYEWDFSFLKREGNIKYWNNKMKYSKFIHWFEFCWKILNKILSNNKAISPVYVQKCILDFGTICFNNSEFQHPVDYLYEKFKQNEKN